MIPLGETTLFSGEVSQFAAASIDLGGRPIKRLRFEIERCGDRRGPHERRWPERTPPADHVGRPEN